MKKINFNLDWNYSEASDTFSLMMAQWEPVNLPHDLAITKPRDKNYPTGRDGGYAWSGVVTYRKKFIVSEEWHGQVVQLEFEGVYMNAEVSVNHQLVFLHPYGYTSFIVDLTPHLKFGEENMVEVFVNNSAQPNSRWYSGTGIYRHVWLRIGGPLHIKPWGVFITSPTVDPHVSIVNISTEVEGPPSGAVLRSTILDSSGKTVTAVETPIEIPTTQQALSVKDAKLWSVDEPHLYKLTSEILVDGEVKDDEKTTFGIRSISIDPENGFQLNGLTLKLKGGCVHHDNGLLGAASYDRAEERKIELLKSSGFNAVRCAHNPPAPAFLDACDSLGMLVINESFDCWRTRKHPNDYHLFFEDWWQRDTESKVKRDRNHPSIILWSIGNEVTERTGVSDGAAWALKQANFIRKLDPTRGITASIHFLFEVLMSQPELLGKISSVSTAQEFFALKNQVPESIEQDPLGTLTKEFCEALDIVGLNYLYQRYAWDHDRFPERVMMGSESYPVQAYDFWQAALNHPFVIGDFVWTAMDYLGESGVGKVSVDDPNPMDHRSGWPYHLANCGDIDICGIKRPQSIYRDLMWGARSEPFIAVLDPSLYGKKIELSQWAWDPVLDSWTFPGNEGMTTRVDIYSIDEEIELVINGASMGKKPAGAAVNNKTSFEVTYQPGRIEAIGYSGGEAVSWSSLETAGTPAAIHLSADQAALNAEYGDLAYVTAEIVDAKGNMVKYADPEIKFYVSGAGKLIAAGTGDPVSEDNYISSVGKAWQGRRLAIVCSSGQEGQIDIEAFGDGLSSDKITLQSEGKE